MAQITLPRARIASSVADPAARAGWLRAKLAHRRASCAINRSDVMVKSAFRLECGEYDHGWGGKKTWRFCGRWCVCMTEQATTENLPAIDMSDQAQKLEAAD